MTAPHRYQWRYRAVCNAYAVGSIADIRVGSTAQERHPPANNTHRIAGYFDLRRLGSGLPAARIA